MNELPSPSRGRGASESVRLPRLRRVARVVVSRLSLLAIFLLVWGLLAQRMPAFVLPGLGRTWDAWKVLVHSGTFLDDVGITMYRVVAGFLLGAVVGTPLGILLGSNRRLGDYFEPVLAVLNTVSSAIWAIFALIWFGISNSTVIFVVFMEAMPLILTNVWQGARGVNAEHIELARSFQMSRGQIMCKIYLPSVLPYFFSGARLAFGFGWRVSLVAETIGSPNGIGYRLHQAADLVQTNQVFAWTFTLIVLMMLLEYGALKPLENYLFRWRRKV